jgi:hypothetical protein
MHSSEFDGLLAVWELGLRLACRSGQRRPSPHPSDPSPLLDTRSGFTATVYTEQASPAAAWRFFGLRRDQYLRGASAAEPARPPNKYTQPHNRIREYFCDSVGEHDPRYREPVLAIFCSWREGGGRGRVVTLTAGVVVGRRASSRISSRHWRMGRRCASTATGSKPCSPEARWSISS